VGQSASVSLQSQRASLELHFLTSDTTLTRRRDEPLQLGEVHPMEKGLMEVITVPLKGLDQPREQLLTRLIP
jgi:hypothetical protein